MKYVGMLICFIFLLPGCASQPQGTTSKVPASQEFPASSPVEQQQIADTTQKLDEFFSSMPPKVFPSEEQPQAVIQRKTSPDMTTDAKQEQSTPRTPPPADAAEVTQLESLTEPTPVTFQAQTFMPTSLQENEVAPMEENAPNGIGLNFDNADIYDVTRVVSEITGKTFIIDENVRGTVTIFSESSLTPDQVFELFKSVLELNGLAIKQVGDFYKIVPAEAKNYLEPDSGTLLSEEDQIVTRVVKLRHVRAEDVKTAIQSLMPPDRDIMVYPDPVNGDTLIITDIASNVRKILDIIREIDVSKYASQYFRIFPIRYADLTELVHDLNQILTLQETPQAVEPNQPDQQAPDQQTQQPTPPTEVTALVPPGTRTRLYPIARLNALVVSTNNLEVVNLVSKWIDILDQPPIQGYTEPSSPNVQINHFYPVQYAKAEELAPLLAKVYDETIETPPTPDQQDQQNQQDQPDQQNQQNQQVPQPQQPSSQTQRNPSDAPSPEFIPDPKTNTIIIRATDKQYADIKQLLDKLDQRPLQVLIDVIIAEVSLDDTEILGVRWMLHGQDQVTVGGETNSVNATSETVFNSVLPENAEGFTYVVTAPGRFLSKLRALAAENKVKILSDPHILVRNNEEAIMNVGSRIPIQEETTDADGETTTSIRYEEAGIILTVTPQINMDGDVVLKIKQEVSDVGQEQYGATGAASFTTREAETSVITQDGYPIVIGGLIQNRDEDIITGVPFFKDIPLLGRLFRYSEKINRRQDLFILVTPRVIRTPGQGWAVTDNVLEQRVQELEKLFNREGTDTDKLKDFLRNPTLK